MNTLGRAFVVCLVLAGCRPGAVEPIDAAPLPAASSFVELLERDAEARRSMRSLGRVTYFGERGRVRLNAVLLAERPGRLRVETLSPLEQPVDVMVTDGQRLSLLSGGRLREGPATPENLARLIPLSLWPEELVDVLLGGVPKNGRYEARSLARHPDREDHWLLVLVDARGETMELTLEPSTRITTEIRVKAKDGQLRFSVRYDLHEPIEGLPGELPRQIVFEMTDPELEVTIKLKELEVNVPIAPTLFELAAPPGVPVERLDSPPVPLPEPTP